MGPERGKIPAMDIIRTVYHLGIDLFSFIFSLLGPRSALVAENLFLRKQLALYQERDKKPGRINSASRFTLVACAPQKVDPTQIECLKKVA